MAREIEPHDITDTPDVVRLAEEVASTGVSIVLSRSGVALAILSPISAAERSSEEQQPRGAPPNSWLDDLVGIGASKQSDVSANVHRYIAQALGDESEQPPEGPPGQLHPCH